MWKEIKDYENLYEININGEIRSVKRIGTKGKYLKFYKNKDGYYQVQLCKNGKRKTHFVHILMAKTFLNYNSLLQVNHINEIKTDNRLENLEMISQLENLNHGTRNKRISEANKNRKDMSKRIIAYKYESMEMIGIFESTKEVERILGVYHSHVSKCCKGKIRQAKGYTFSYDK
jgi:hypothetical protein